MKTCSLPIESEKELSQNADAPWHRSKLLQHIRSLWLLTKGQRCCLGLRIIACTKMCTDEGFSSLSFTLRNLDEGSGFRALGLWVQVWGNEGVKTGRILLGQGFGGFMAKYAYDARLSLLKFRVKVSVRCQASGMIGQRCMAWSRKGISKTQG